MNNIEKNVSFCYLSPESRLSVVICSDKEYKWWKIYVSAFTCPGDCSNAGFCDTSTGQCSCDPGHHDQDCSSKIQQYLLPKKA